MTQSPRILGVVLAGGASRRMGVDKLRLSRIAPEGPTILDHVVQVVASCCTTVFVLGDPGRHPAGYATSCPGRIRWLRDDEPFHGPLAALAAAWPKVLAADSAGCDAVVVAAGDLPGLVPTVLNACLERIVASLDAVLVARDGRWQPLLGVYAARAGQALSAAAATGETRLMSAIERMRVVPLSADQLGWPEWWTRPVHTRRDYADWLQEMNVDEARDSR